MKGVVVKDSNASFPVLTLGNTKNLAFIRQKVDALALKNLIINIPITENIITYTII